MHQKEPARSPSPHEGMESTAAGGEGATMQHLVSIKRAKVGSFWSNRLPDSDQFKNVGGINKTVVPITKFLKWMPKRIVQNLPKKPKEGYEAFGQRMFKPCNMAEEIARLRADPVTADQDHAFWIGHASQLLCLQSGTNIILDPIYSKRASPFQFIGPKRRYAPATQLDELPKIDMVLISHNHYDHLDKQGVKGIFKRNPSTRFVVPMNMSYLLTKWGIPRASITEMDWQDEIIINDVVICCTPAQHWGKHSLFDNNKVLWCGWVIGWHRDMKAFDLSSGQDQPAESSSSSDGDVARGAQFSPTQRSFDRQQQQQQQHRGVTSITTNSYDDSNRRADDFPLSPGALDERNNDRTLDNLLPVHWPSLKTYYFTGDTAFNEVVFELIRARIDHIDMAALPIGAYAPRWFMHGQHIDPESAVKVFKIVNCKRAYGVHYGTFELADEPLDEPAQVLATALSIEEVPADRFVCIPMGHHVSF